MPTTAYKVDERRVYTGETKVFAKGEPITSDYIVVAPPTTEGFHIWDGAKWFTRAEYPFPVVVEPQPEPRKTQLTQLEFRNQFTMQEKIAIYDAAKTDTIVQIFLDDINAAEYIDISHPDVISGVEYLATATIILPDRIDDLVVRTEDTP